MKDKEKGAKMLGILDSLDSVEVSQIHTQFRTSQGKRETRIPLIMYCFSNPPTDNIVSMIM